MIFREDHFGLIFVVHERDARSLAKPSVFQVCNRCLRQAAILEAETRYFDTSEMTRAWEWARGAKYAEDMPVRQISAGTGIWKDYHPEYMDI